MVSPEAIELNKSFRADIKDSGMFTLPFDEQRSNWDAFGDTIPEYSADVSIEPDSCNDVPCEWVIAPGAHEDKILLHLHGGGYVIGHPNGYRNYNSRVSEAIGAPVLAVDYSLAPEFPFPTAIEDCLNVYKWVLEHGYEPENVAFTGESAGGGLVFATLLAARDEKIPLPAAAVAISPWIDLTNSGASHQFNEQFDPMIGPAVLDMFAAAYINGDDLRNPLASPIFSELAGLPPIYLLVGSTEVLLDDARTLFMKLSRAGVDTTIEVAPNMPHIWPIFAYQIPEGRTAIARMSNFFKTHLN